MHDLGLVTFLFVIIAVLVFDRHVVIGGLEKDLNEYIAKAQEVVDSTGNPHYKAVVVSISGILSRYFPEKEF